MKQRGTEGAKILSYKGIVNKSQFQSQLDSCKRVALSASFHKGFLNTARLCHFFADSRRYCGTVNSESLTRLRLLMRGCLGYYGLELGLKKTF